MASNTLFDRLPVLMPGDVPAFFQGYVARALDPAWRADWLAGPSATGRWVSRRVEREGDFRYADGKWSVREVLGHMIDTERIFTYRALRIARGDTTPLPGFDQDTYVPHSGAERRSLVDLAEEFEVVRRSTRLLLGSLDAEATARRGVSSGHPVTAGALFHATAGHEAHHIALFRNQYGME